MGMRLLLKYQIDLHMQTNSQSAVFLLNSLYYATEDY